MTTHEILIRKLASITCATFELQLAKQKVSHKNDNKYTHFAGFCPNKCLQWRARIISILGFDEDSLYAQTA